MITIASNKVEQTDLENFNEFLRDNTDIFAKNVVSTEDHIYKELKTLANKKCSHIKRLLRFKYRNNE